MRIVGSAVARAPPDAVWAWWTDYGAEGDSERLWHGFVSTRREVVRADERHVVFRESVAGPVGRFDHDVVIDAKARTLRERHLGGLPVSYAATWRFEPEDDGRATRITREIDAAVPGPGAVLELALPLSRRLVEADIRAHIRDFERDRARGRTA